MSDTATRSGRKDVLNFIINILITELNLLDSAWYIIKGEEEEFYDDEMEEFVEDGDYFDKFIFILGKDTMYKNPTPFAIISIIGTDEGNGVLVINEKTNSSEEKISKVIFENLRDTQACVKVLVDMIKNTIKK